jgi:hypothetical protein
MEARYGRLFTERDVEGIVEHISLGAPNARAAITLLDMTPDAWLKTSPRDPSGFTFPADEPLFLLRATDPAAHRAVWHYAYEAKWMGASDKFVRQALKASDDMREWGEGHLDRLKVPN